MWVIFDFFFNRPQGLVERQRCAHTLFEGQQQQRRETCGDGGEQQNATPTVAVGQQIKQDAGRTGGAHSHVVVQIKVGGVAVEVRGETMLDGSRCEAAGKEEEENIQPFFIMPC